LEVVLAIIVDVCRVELEHVVRIVEPLAIHATHEAPAGVRGGERRDEDAKGDHEGDAELGEGWEQAHGGAPCGVSGTERCVDMLPARVTRTGRFCVWDAPRALLPHRSASSRVGR